MKCRLAMLESPRAAEREVSPKCWLRPWDRRLGEACLSWLCWLAFSLGLALCQPVLAAYYLQEGFNYAPGTLGTNSPWANPTNLITVVPDSLTCTNLADFYPPGGAVSVTQGSASSPSVTYRPLDTTATSGSAYYALLIQVNSVGVSSYIAGLLPPTVGLPNGNASDPCDLYIQSATGGYNLGVRAKNGNTAYAGATLAIKQTYLVVLKCEFASGRASLFVAPSPGGSEPATPDATSTGGIAVTSLNHFYLRVSGPNAGSFIVDSVRAASSWAEVTPLGQIALATRLVFATSPTSGTAGAAMASIIVEIRNDTGFDVPSNGVPITVTLNMGAFASGTPTLNSDAYGRATFNDLAAADAGTYTLTASASGIGAGLLPAMSGPIAIGSTNITEQGHALSAFLTSLQVEHYWDNGQHVNWLTGGPGGTGTNITIGYASHCSAFAAAAAYELGVFLPHPPDPSDMGLANYQADWLATNGTAGWYAIPLSTDAQHIANVGALVVASLKEIDGSSGHIAVLRPSTKCNSEILTNGPQECQSGIYNYNDTDVITGFGQHGGTLDGILYYGHAVTNPIVPISTALGPGCCSNAVFRLPALSVVGRRYKLQCSSNLVSWTNVLAYTNSNEGTDFWCVTPLVDIWSPTAPRRFYRLLAQ